MPIWLDTALELTVPLCVVVEVLELLGEDVDVLPVCDVLF